MRALARLIAVASLIGAGVVLVRDLFNRQDAGGTEAAAGTAGPGSAPTREELYEEAQRLEIKGRSQMNKAQLARAVGKAKEETP